MRPRATTLKFQTGAVRPQEAVSAADQRQVNLEARRALHPMKVAWLAVGDIDETPPALNSRQAYDEASINELAASVAEHGILQPLCVRPISERYLLVYGMRRLKAAIRAGLQEVPCTIQVADDDRAFLLNTVENLHRRQLSGAERIAAIERIAATDIGVRELGRRTGFAHTTIARWLKIDRRPALKEAVEQGQLDIGRAMVLASAPAQVADRLLPRAASIPQSDLWKAVAEAREEVVHNAPPSAFVEDDKRLADIEAKLTRVRVIGPVGLAHLERIRDLVLVLLSQTATDMLLAGAATDLERLPAPRSTAFAEHTWPGERRPRQARTVKPTASRG